MAYAWQVNLIIILMKLCINNEHFKIALLQVQCIDLITYLTFKNV